MPRLLINPNHLLENIFLGKLFQRTDLEHFGIKKSDGYSGYGIHATGKHLMPIGFQNTFRATCVQRNNGY